ncbi:MAG: DUF3486 family protein [Gammaproteobacteria bacterium]|nr:DUF3486 family protein [Gammaproteobacteria bacterium]
MKTNNDNLDRLRCLRILQALHRSYPDPQGEIAVLNALQTDPELSPTIERVRRSLSTLGEKGLVELLRVDNSDWMAGRVTSLGMAFLAAENTNGVEGVYHPSEKPEPDTTGLHGRNSSITSLPSEVKAWLDQELVRRRFTGYIDLAVLLEGQGYEISKSAIGRYGKKFKEEQKQLRQSIEMAKAFAEVVGDDGAAMNQTLTALAQQELMSVIRNGEYDEDIKLPALIRSIASLNRSDVNTRKFQIEQAARHKALDEAADAVEIAAQQQGLTKDQAQFWRQQVLGVK